MTTKRMTMAQALVRFLNQQYVEVDGEEQPFIEGVITIFWHGNVLGIGQALKEEPDHLRVHQGCNEQGMAHIATGFAKQHQRQRIYAVTSSVGPGAANMFTAKATANRIPLLLPGDIYASRILCFSKSSCINILESAPTTASSLFQATGIALIVHSN